jgi:hypothetical protein
MYAPGPGTSTAAFSSKRFVEDLKMDCGFGTSTILMSSLALDTTTFSLAFGLVILYWPMQR